MEAVPILRTMTFSKLLEELHERGMTMSPGKLKIMIERDLLPFAHHIPMKRDEYIIWRKGFEEWVEEHSVMETPI